MSAVLLVSSFTCIRAPKRNPSVTLWTPQKISVQYRSWSVGRISNHIIIYIHICITIVKFVDSTSQQYNLLYLFNLCVRHPKALTLQVHTASFHVIPLQSREVDIGCVAAMKSSRCTLGSSHLDAGWRSLIFIVITCNLARKQKLLSFHVSFIPRLMFFQSWRSNLQTNDISSNAIK